jgi:hypothetical protein
MAKYIELQKAEIKKETNLIWNSFIQLIAESKTEELNENQSIAQPPGCMTPKNRQGSSAVL